MSDVFISYSRRAIDFVRYLCDQLMLEKKALGRLLTDLNTIRRLDVMSRQVKPDDIFVFCLCWSWDVNTLILDDFAVA